MDAVMSTISRSTRTAGTDFVLHTIIRAATTGAMVQLRRSPGLQENRDKWELLLNGTGKTDSRDGRTRTAPNNVTCS